MSDRIKYASCWEDADILLSAVNLSAGSKIISIASGGDNSFALLSTAPKVLYAVDMNKSQLYICELKALAFSQLEYEEMLDFVLGRNNSLNVYEKIKINLSKDALIFWDENKDLIEKGIVNAGKFENYFTFFRKKIMPFIHTKKRIQSLLQDKNASEQKEFYHKTWNSFRWKFFFKIFFSKFVLGRFGRTKSYLNQVGIPVAEYIYKQAENHLQHTNCQKNYFLHFIFTGNIEPILPFYLRKENFEKIKQNIQVLVLKEGLIDEFITKEEAFDFCNFSNIFEYMSEAQFKVFHEKLKENLAPKAKIAYWNLMVDRIFSSSFPNDFKPILTLPREEDKGFFYKRFVAEEKNVD